MFRSMSLMLIAAVTLLQSLPGGSKVRELPTNRTRHSATRLTSIALMLHVVIVYVHLFQNIVGIIQESRLLDRCDQIEVQELIK